MAELSLSAELFLKHLAQVACTQQQHYSDNTSDNDECNINNDNNGSNIVNNNNISNSSNNDIVDSNNSDDSNNSNLMITWDALKLILSVMSPTAIVATTATSDDTVVHHLAAAMQLQHHPWSDPPSYKVIFDVLK